MSHFSHAPAGLDGLHGLAVSRLPQLTSLLKQNIAPTNGRAATPAAIDPEYLRALVSQVFGATDHILFDVCTANVAQRGTSHFDQDRQLLRVDAAADGSPAPVSLKRLIAALGLAKAKETLRKNDWVVLVADETTLDLERATELLEQFDDLRRFLLIWCGAQTQATAGADAQPAPSANEAGRTAPFDRDGLIAALMRLKAQSTAAVLDLQLHQAFLGPEPANGRVTGLANDTTSVDAAAMFTSAAFASATGFRTSATVDALVQLAALDRRVVFVSLDAQKLLAPLAELYADRYFEIPVADSDALAWCAGLAAGGCRPVICASDQALARCWSTLADEICRPQHAVKLVVLTSTGTAASGTSSSLGMLRLLPDTPLLVPRDRADLAAMFEFAVAYDGPASIWCCESALAGTSDALASEGARPHWQFGRAEVTGPSGDVTLVGWGETAASAQRAAEFLAPSGIRTTIVNARFLQPLDREAIVGAARTARICLVLDDPRQHAGFAAGVLELLAQAGVTTPASVLPMARGQAEHDVRCASDDFALTISDRCRWLAQPVRPEFRFSSHNDQPDGDLGSAPAVGWLQLFGGGPVDTPSVRSGVSHAGAPRAAQPLISLPAEIAARSAGLAESDLAAEQRQIQAVEFSADMRRWIRDYEMVGNRNVYLWRWCLHGVELTTLPCVALQLRAHARDTKLLSIVLCVLLDDVADQHGDGEFLDTLLELTTWGKGRSIAGLTTEKRRHAELTQALWQEYLARVANYPCQATYEQVLRYDLRQFLNTMRYSHLVNSRPYLINLAEHDLYTSHNMMMVSFATIDLLCSPGFPRAEAGALREAVWHAQCMGRIGNLLSTWRREIAAHDFTSGVVARALMEGDLTLEGLDRQDAREIERAICDGGHEAYFRHAWHEHRALCHNRARRIASIDMREVLAGHDRFFAMHLGSQGLI